MTESVSILQCPSCGSTSVLVSTEAPFIIHSRGSGHFHLGRPWGEFSNLPIPDGAHATCNHHGCGWQGKLREALPDG